MAKIAIDWARKTCPEDVNARLQYRVAHKVFLRRTAGFPVKEPNKNKITICTD